MVVQIMLKIESGCVTLLLKNLPRRAKMLNRGGFSNHLGAKVTVNVTFCEAVGCAPRLSNKKTKKKKKPRGLGSGPLALPPGEPRSAYVPVARCVHARFATTKIHHPLQYICRECGRPRAPPWVKASKPWTVSPCPRPRIRTT